MEDDVASVSVYEGSVGVSANIVQFQYDIFCAFLERVSLNSVRQEKGLPDAMDLMVRKDAKSLFAFLLSEPVPDLTDKRDISPVKNYLETQFAKVTF